MVPGITTVVTDKVHGSTFIRGSCLLLHVRYLVLFTSGALVHAVLDGWVLGLVSKIGKFLRGLDTTPTEILVE